MIEFFCSKIPRDVSQPMYAEYSTRIAEVKYLLENKAYVELKSNMDLIEMLLALSIFYKRVITNLESATKFSGTVFKMSEAEYIKVGQYKLTPKENRRIQSVVRNYRELISKYNIPQGVIDYSATNEFLKGIKRYKWACERREKDI
jgi:hypothetical protein